MNGGSHALCSRWDLGYKSRMARAGGVGDRAMHYLGLRTDSAPAQRGWLARIGNPAFATSQRDRWWGALFFAFLAIIAVFILLTAGTWFWYLIGAIDLLISLPYMIRCLIYIGQRRPTL
jgi:hypothetical protein